MPLLPPPQSIAERVADLEGEVAELRVAVQELRIRLSEVESFEIVGAGYSSTPAPAPVATPKSRAAPKASAVDSSRAYIPEGAERW